MSFNFLKSKKSISYSSAEIKLNLIDYSTAQAVSLLIFIVSLVIKSEVILLSVYEF